MIRQIDNAIRERELYELTKDLVCFLQERKCFTKEKSNRTLSKEELSRGFYYTRKACSEMDYDEFSRVRYFKSITLEGAVPMLQLLQLYRNEAMDKEDAYKLLTEWNNISEEEAEEYCKYIDWQLARIERLENKREVLQYILDNKMVIERSIENKNLQYDTSFEKLLQLFAKTEELLEKVGYTPFSYFEEYEKIERKRKRLAEQRGAKGKYQYLFDGILSMLGVTFVTDKEIEVPLTKAFEMTYILHQLFGTCDGNRKYMYIDEFQDFSPIELRMVRTMYPSAVLNVFGDVNQCINCKGIMQLDDIPEEIYSDKYEIKENYRNAREITTYVKDNLNIAMEPYGLEGIQKTVEEIPEITVADDDRVAVIVEDDSMISADIREKTKLNFYSDSKEILRGIYNVIPVTMTKGLEFEKVIVVQRGMDKNQFYVACTRAISELYVVSDNYQDMLSKEKLLPEPIKGLKENPFLDSYVIEFLDLPKNFKESDLRKGLIQNMKEFILEVGKDFTFIDEEYRVQVGGEDFRIDLLFFHRGLQCLVAFELKIGKFKPEYISKMDFYLEALDRQKKKENENPSVGMILCASKDDEVVEYAMSRTLSPMMVAEYKLQLPDKVVLQKKLQELINMPLIEE